MIHRPIATANRRLAKTMRRRMTEAELRLWSNIRGHRLAGLGFRRQSPIGPFIADFFCAEHKLIVEVDGSHHGLPAQSEADRERTAWLESRGYKVVRFLNLDVLTNLNGVCDTILDAVSDRDPPPPEIG